MRKYVYIIFCGIVLFGCAHSSKSVKNGNNNESNSDTLSGKNKAIEHFINGTVSELKGNYADAIIEYQEALNYDPKPGVYFALGKNYLRLKKLPAALRYTRKAVKLEPKEIEYKYLLSEIFSVSHENDSAIVVLNDIIREDSLEFNAYYRLGELYEKDKPLRALEVYEKLVELAGPEWSVLLKIADLNERMGRVEKTVETMESLLKLNPSNLNLEKLLIESYLKIGKLGKAENKLNETLALYPHDVDLIKYKADLLAQQGKWEASAKEYEKIMDSGSIPLQEKLRIGSLFVRQEEKDTTLNVNIEKLLSKADSDSAAWQLKVFLGELAIKRNDTTKAISYFKSAAHSAEWNPQLWIRLGLLLFDEGKYGRVIDELGYAVQNFPDEFVINVVLGLALSQKNKNSQAEKYLEKAVELNPNDVTALSALGFTLNQLNKNNEALIYLNQALDLDSTNTQVLGLLGLIYNSRKKWDLSDKYYERALQLDSTNIVLLNNYAYSLSERGIQLDRALRMVKKAVEAEPDNSAYLDTIGWIYYKMGKYNLALEYINKAVMIDEKSAEQMEHLGDVYYKLGNIKKANYYWKKALELDPKRDEVKLKIEEEGM